MLAPAVPNPTYDIMHWILRRAMMMNGDHEPPQPLVTEASLLRCIKRCPQVARWPLWSRWYPPLRPAKSSMSLLKWSLGILHWTRSVFITPLIISRLLLKTNTRIPSDPPRIPTHFSTPEVVCASRWISADFQWIWTDFLHVDSYVFLNLECCLQKYMLLSQQKRVLISLKVPL